MRLEGPAIARDTHFEADVCVVGGGVAGLILADALGDLPLDVIVVESGEPDDVVPGGAVDMTYESSQSELEPILASRARALGGTAVVWNTFLKNQPAARYLRMESVDFEDREGRPHGGWPFGIVELEPYYEAAEPLCMPGFDASARERAATSHGLPFDARRVAAVAEGFGLADQFTERLPRAVLKKSRVKVITGATVAEIRTNEQGSRAERVEVTSGAGKSFSVGFRTLVVAAGTIENARLLLASQRSRPRGIGNDHDVVGRYYMDHQRLNAGHLFPDDPELFERAVFLDFRAHGSLYFMGKLKLSESLIREQRLLNSSTLFWPRPRAADDRGVDAMKDLARALKSRRFGAEALGYAGEVARASRYLATTGPRLALVQRTRAPNISRGGWSHLKRNRDRFEYFELVQQIEQVPNPDNRVTLGETRDRLGLRLPRISAKFSPEDLESARRSQRLFAEELERCGMGRVVYEGDGSADLHQTGGIHHHLGSTRMHTDPKRGVVDADCRVHGVDNLFIAGGSVFPTGGYANPTLTIAALTLRLAAHLKATLARVGGRNA